MHFTLEDHQVPSSALKATYPKNFEAASGISDQFRKESFNQQQVTTRDIFFPGVRIFYHHRPSLKKNAIDTTIDYPYYQMFFWLKGSGGNKPAGGKTTFFAGEQQHYINYSPGFEGTYYINGDREEAELLQIHLTGDFFKRLVQEDNSVLYALAENGAAKKAFHISNPSMILTPRMNAVIREMVQYPEEGVFKRIFMESRILDLLFQQLAQAQEPYLSTCDFSKSDIEKLRYARQLLENHFLDPPSATELAKLTCLNAFKLKKGFKALFHTTPFHYVNTIRLEYGRKLLLSTDQNISEVAYSLGYNFPHHFSNAFRKEFGYLPGTLKKTTKIKPGH